MSGGSLNYFYSMLEEHVGDFGDKELDDLIRDLVNLFHAREWFLSMDSCEGDWNETRDSFKRKWFSPLGRQERIEKYLEQIRDDVMKSFGMSERYCMNCMNWTPENKDDSPYGECSITKGCLMHKCESCEQFDLKSE